jgi:hypothetical protein
VSDDWVEALRTSASVASTSRTGIVWANWISDLLRENGIEAHVSPVRPKDSVPMWDDSIPLVDTVSVLVRKSDIMKVRALYEDLAEGELEIDEDFDPGEPTPDV